MAANYDVCFLDVMTPPSTCDASSFPLGDWLDRLRWFGATFLKRNTALDFSANQNSFMTF